jgi:hypothetical protein
MSIEHSPQRQRRRPRRGNYPPMLIPVLDAFDMLGVGVTKGYELIDQRLLDSVLNGRRRYVTRDSMERLAAKLQAANQPDNDIPPERNALKAVVDAYEAGLKPDPVALETAISTFEEILNFLLPLRNSERRESQAEDA